MSFKDENPWFKEKAPNMAERKWSEDFQTPFAVCDYMTGLLPVNASIVLEPTPGQGNLVNIMQQTGYKVEAWGNYFAESKDRRFDAICMNPPFSSRYAYGIPEKMTKSGMALGYHILTECMQMSDCVIALMPWFTISDSDNRLESFKRWGLKSVTALPRKTFQYARIQTVVLELVKGWTGATELKVFTMLGYVPQPTLF